MLKIFFKNLNDNIQILKNLNKDIRILKKFEQLIYRLYRDYSEQMSIQYFTKDQVEQKIKTYKNKTKKSQKKESKT